MTQRFSYVKASSVRNLPTIHNLREEETVAPKKLVISVVMGVLLLCLAQPGYSQFARHHIGINIGYFKAFSDDLKEEAIGWDLTNGGLGAFNYRYSFNPIIDMAIESRAWVATDEVLGRLGSVLDSLTVLSGLLHSNLCPSIQLT